MIYPVDFVIRPFNNKGSMSIAFTCGAITFHPG